VNKHQELQKQLEQVLIYFAREFDIKIIDAIGVMEMIKYRMQTGIPLGDPQYETIPDECSDDDTGAEESDRFWDDELGGEG